MKITMQEIETAIASAAPAEGEPWQANTIARNIARLVAAEADEEWREREAWESGRSHWAVRFSPTEGPIGKPAAIAEWQGYAMARHREEVQERLRRNRDLLSGIGATIVALGTGALTGDLTRQALVAGAMGIANQIASALNDDAA